MKKIIAFSLWGSNPKYTIGAIFNAKLASVIYPDWMCEFYVGSDVSKNILSQLKNQTNTTIIHKKDPNDWTGMFWRFHAGYTSDIAIFRDTDSRLSFREKYAVDEWLESEKTFHIMRDHPYHKFPVLGGMWGFKNNNKYPLKDLLNNFDSENKYGTDYDFLGNVVYPLIRDDKIVHDPFFDKKPFPSKRIDTEFVGDVFDEKNNRHPEFFKQIENTNETNVCR
jgi:protein O-GlcNAc transferase